MKSFEKDMKKVLNKYIVEFKLVHKSSDIIHGIIVNHSSSLILVANLDDNFYLNGYVLIRIEDIWEYRIFDQPDHFLFMAQKELNLYPKSDFCLDLTNIKNVCNNIHKFYPLVTIYKEKSEDIAYVGVITKVKEHSFLFYEISPEAKWDKEYRFYLKKISRIDWGGGYENALWQVGKNYLPEQCKKSLISLDFSI